MQVETFECHETASEPIEATEEAKDLAMKLGLAGQLSLMNADRNGIVRRSPYREMTADETWVYQELCPETKPLSEYSASPVPLRVLQIAAHAVEAIPGCRMVVWDRVSATVVDPVLVAEIGQYEWMIKKRYILARWGEELEAFATLIRQAASMRRDRMRTLVKKIAANIETASDAEIGTAALTTTLM